MSTAFCTRHLRITAIASLLATAATFAAPSHADIVEFTMSGRVVAFNEDTPMPHVGIGTRALLLLAFRLAAQRSLRQLSRSPSPCGAGREDPTRSEPAARAARIGEELSEHWKLWVAQRVRGRSVVSRQTCQPSRGIGGAWRAA